MLNAAVLLSLIFSLIATAISFVALRRLPPLPTPGLRKARLATMGLAAVVGVSAAAGLLQRVV